MTTKTAKTDSTARATEIPVLVTTAHRGVFFGYATRADAESGGETITLQRSRLCTYWSPAMRGFMGLAALGPDKDCKIGPAVPRQLLRNVTAVSECTDAAARAWESAPWSGR